MKSIKLIIPDAALTAVLKAIVPVAVHIDIADEASADDAPAAGKAHSKATEKLWSSKSKEQPKPNRQGAGTTISVADTILRDFMSGDEPVRLAQVRQHLVKIGFNRNSASSAFDTLIKRGDVTRIGEALYQRVNKSAAQA